MLELLDTARLVRTCVGFDVIMKDNKDNSDVETEIYYIS